MEGRGRMESGGKMRAALLRKGKKEVDRREGREEEGICRTNVKVLPTPLAYEEAPKVTLDPLRRTCARTAIAVRITGSGWSVNVRH